MGTICVHDRRPGSENAPVDDYGYGPEVAHTRARRPMELGQLVELSDGSQWPVVSSRLRYTPLAWRQAVAVGVDVVAPETMRPAEWGLIGALVA